MVRKKSPKQLDAEIKTSLAERAIAKGFEPETQEGGRAMLQSLTLADLNEKPRLPRLASGTPVTVTLCFVGGTEKRQGVVTWDNGRGKVNVRVPGYGNRVMSCTKDDAGNLSTYDY